MNVRRGSSVGWIAVVVAVVGLIFLAHQMGLSRGDSVRDDLKTKLDLAKDDIQALQQQLKQGCAEAEVRVKDDNPPGIPEPASGKLLTFDVSLSLGQEAAIPGTDLTVALEAIERKGETLEAVVRLSKGNVSQDVSVPEERTTTVEGFVVEAVEVTASQALLRIVATL
jgi:hypothetical protein